GAGGNRFDVDLALVLVALENDLSGGIRRRERLSAVSIDASNGAAIARIDVAKHLGDVGAIDLDAGRFLQGDGGLDRDSVTCLDRLQRERGCRANHQRPRQWQKLWSQCYHCQAL